MSLLHSFYSIGFLLINTIHRVFCSFSTFLRFTGFCGGRTGKLLYILAHLGDVFPDFHTFFCGTDARDDFRKSLCHKLITPVGTS